MLRPARRRLKSVVRRLIGDPPVPLEEMPLAPRLFTYYRELIECGHERAPGGWLYKGKFYPDHLTVGGACFGAFRPAAKHCHGRGIDVGAGSWPYPGSTPIDTSYGADSVRVSDIPDGSLDYVFSSHTLEHIRDWQKALTQWIAKLRPGGTVFLYLPHPDCGLWSMDNPFMKQHHVWTPTPQVVKDAVAGCGCRIVDFDDGPDVMYSFFVCGKRES